MRLQKKFGEGIYDAVVLMTRIIIAVSLALTLSLASFPINADDSGTTCLELLTHCEALKNLPQSTDAKDLANASLCVGYIAGYAAAFVTYEDVTSDVAIKPRLYCAPKDTTVDEYIRIFMGWANNHPEELHATAGLCLGAALTQAFPCSHPR